MPQTSGTYATSDTDITLRNHTHGYLTNPSGAGGTVFAMAVVSGDGYVFKNGDANGNAKFSGIKRKSAGIYDFSFDPAAPDSLYNVQLTRVYRHPLEGEIIVNVDPGPHATGFQVINENDDAAIADPSAFYVLVMT